MKRLLTLFTILILLAACSAKDSSMTNFNQTDAPQKGEQIATIQTNKGTIKIRLFTKLIPETSKNFAELSKKGFYDGLIFHRTIDNFMIQGGDPLGNGTGGETYKGPGTKLKDEFSDKLTHLRGAISMANAGPNTGSSQFFIVQRRNGVAQLDGKHAIFGQVIEGMDVVDAIAAAPTDADDRPLSEVKMEKVTIEEVK